MPPHSVDAVAARIAELHLDPATAFLVGLAIAPLVGDPTPDEPNGVDSDPPPRQRRAPARRPNGGPQARMPPLKRAQTIFAKHPHLSAKELQKKARCGASVAISVVGKRQNGAAQREMREAEPAGPD